MGHNWIRVLAVVAFALLFASNAAAQSVRAVVGTGMPDVTDGAFDGNLGDITPGSAEMGNFLFLDLESTDPSLSIQSVTLNFAPSLNVEIDYRVLWLENLAGATIVSETTTTDTFDATFNGLTASIDTFFLGFDFDRRSIHTQTPYGSEYVGGTVSVTLSNGTVLTGTLAEVDILNASVQMGAVGPNVDVWIKDCEADDGSEPSTPNCPAWWTSPDIYIDNDGNQIIDEPVYGQENQLRAIVRNAGTDTASSVSVAFYFRDNHTGLQFPDGATLIGTASVSVAGGSVALATVPWTIPNPPAGGGHWCIGVVLNHSEDVLTAGATPPEENNIGIANIWFIAGRAGEEVGLAGTVGTGGKSGFGLGDWPRDFTMRVVHKLPEGWKVRLEGIPRGAPFKLELGEEKNFRVLVQTPKGAKPRDGGDIVVEQVDVKTGRVVGGLTYRVREDHNPPARISRVLCERIGKRARLTWERISTEAETGQRERVVHYEVLRDGKVMATPYRDEDPLRHGFQWTTDSLDRASVYTVLAVDLGGLRGKPSPPVDPGFIGDVKPGLFNWLTYVLIGLLVAVLIVKRSS